MTNNIEDIVSKILDENPTKVSQYKDNPSSSAFIWFVRTALCEGKGRYKVREVANTLNGSLANRTQFNLKSDINDLISTSMRRL